MNASKIQKYFKLARNASTFSTFHKQKLGAIIVYKNQILSVGWNMEKTMPMQKKYNSLRNFDVDIYPNRAHAEMVALNRLIKTHGKDIDYSKCAIFVYRNKLGKRGLARPCPACEAALRDVGIRNVYYTGENSYIHEIYD